MLYSVRTINRAHGNSYNELSVIIDDYVRIVNISLFHSIICTRHGGEKLTLRGEITAKESECTCFGAVIFSLTAPLHSPVHRRFSFVCMINECASSVLQNRTGAVHICGSMSLMMGCVVVRCGAHCPFAF